MSNLVVVAANKLIDASVGTTALTAFVGAPKIRLTSTAPTNAAAGTELVGSGYTTGGTAAAFAAASGGSAAGPTSALLWTNASGGAWTIVGVEVWDQAGTPLRWWWGTFTGQPITIPNGVAFQIAISGLTAAL